MREESHHYDDNFKKPCSSNVLNDMSLKNNDKREYKLVKIARIELKPFSG